MNPENSATDCVDVEELNKKYQALLEENRSLKAEIRDLKRQNRFPDCPESVPEMLPLFDEKPSDSTQSFKIAGDVGVTKLSPASDKIELFMSLFKGREDVYAKRWENKAGKCGYSPVCLNEWKPGLCEKPRKRCSECKNRSYAVLNKGTVESHLRGLRVIGIYPLCCDETCHFLAIDFDDDGWQQDVGVLREVCREFEIPIAVERSMSGNGAHAWFFFEENIAAATARRFGSALLTHAMEKRHEIKFKSYDRLFPNQDVMPKGGLGNLIAAPLQMMARKNDNSVFVDEQFSPYQDQWEFLSRVQTLGLSKLSSLITKLCSGSELGYLNEDDPSVKKPWKRTRISLKKQDFPEVFDIVKSGMMFIEKKGFSQQALNFLKRLAAFKNPEYYKAQAMRMSTYGKDRIISCFDDLETHLGLPRGCENDLRELFDRFNLRPCWLDETQHGRSIRVEFKGNLRDEQQEAVESLMRYDFGVLSATTAFGKTIVGANLISKRKVNTLILVHRQQLLSQWIKRLSDFLMIDEQLPELPKKRGRKKKQSLIGQMGAGKSQLSKIIDVATMQSLNSGGEVKSFVREYGMVIVDECHHVPAFSFEQIMKETTAKFVYGLTATPTRRDGHHPILTYQCGPVRFQVDAKKQAEKRPFEHYIIPRFTSFRLPSQERDHDPSFQEIYSELTIDEIRNSLIVDDIVDCHKKGRNSIVLTGRIAHVEAIAEKLKDRIPDVVVLTGGMGAKKTGRLLEEVTATPQDRPLTLVATGKFIGEGFDEPRLDTLFLAMPISWKGTLQQYVGRLHRLCDTKKDVQVYDYVDIHVPMLEKMYGRRLKGYASIGYRAKGESIPGEPADIIFDNHSFFSVYTNDIQNATREILIVSPFVTEKRVSQMMQCFETVLEKQVNIMILTRPAEDFKSERQPILKGIFKRLTDVGINVGFKSFIHQKFAVVDWKIVWYGSINLLGFGISQESVMRLNSGGIAHELMESVNTDDLLKRVKDGTE